MEGCPPPAGSSEDGQQTGRLAWSRVPSEPKGTSPAGTSVLDLRPPDWERMDVCDIAVTFVGTFEGSRGQPTSGRSLSLHLTVLPELSNFTPRRAQLPPTPTPRPRSHPPGCSEGLRRALALGTLRHPRQRAARGSVLMEASFSLPDTAPL